MCIKAYYTKFYLSYKFVVNIRWQRHTLWDDPQSVLYCNSTEPLKCSSFTTLEIQIKKLYYIIIFDESICLEQTSCCAAQQLKLYGSKSYLNRWGNYWSKLHQPCIPSVYLYNFTHNSFRINTSVLHLRMQVFIIATSILI